MDPSTRTWLNERIETKVAVGVGVSWFVLYSIGAELEPAPNRSEPLLGVLLGVALVSLFVAALVGIGMRRRWGLGLSLVAATTLTVMSVMCPVSGHHTFGAWWYGQMLCALGLVGISLAALTRPAGTSKREEPRREEPRREESREGR
jgi:predicted transporter